MKYFYLLVILIFTGCSYKDDTYKIVSLNKKQGILKDGSIIVKPMYENIQSIENKDNNTNHPHLLNLHWIHDKQNKIYSIVTINGKKGIIDENGEFLLKPIYQNIENFYEGFAKIKHNDKYGFINEKFEIVLKPMFDNLSGFNFSDISTFKYNNKYGCIDTSMNMIIKPELDFIYPFFNDLARVQKNNRWGYINKDCEIVIKPIYDYAYEFEDGIAKVKLGSKELYIDNNGKSL